MARMTSLLTVCSSFTLCTSTIGVSPVTARTVEILGSGEDLVDRGQRRRAQLDRSRLAAARMTANPTRRISVETPVAIQNPWVIAGRIQSSMRT